MLRAAASAARKPWLVSYPDETPAMVMPPAFALLGDVATDRAKHLPRKPAFTCVLPNGMAGSLTFAQVDALSDAFAGFLRDELHLKAGERVAVQIPNGLAYPVVAFGIFKAGCVLVNVNPLYTAEEMAKIFADAEPAALVIVDMLDRKSTRLNSSH